jgi:hypothetical protein
MSFEGFKEFTAFRDHVLTAHCIDCDKAATGYLCVRAIMLKGEPGILLGVSVDGGAEVHTFARLKVSDISGVTLLRMPKPPEPGKPSEN